MAWLLPRAANGGRSNFIKAVLPPPTFKVGRAPKFELGELVETYASAVSTPSAAQSCEQPAAASRSNKDPDFFIFFSSPFRTGDHGSADPDVDRRAPPTPPERETP